MKNRAIVLAFGVTLLLLFFPSNNEWDATVLKRIFDAGHYFLFCLLGWIVVSTFLREQPPKLFFARASILLIVFAGAVELIQPTVGRDASWFDFFAGVVGTLIGVSVAFLSPLNRIRHRWTIGAGSFLIGSIFFIPAYRAFEALRWKAHAFPILADFENPLQLRLWRAVSNLPDHNFLIEDDPNIAGNHRLRVDLIDQPWSTICYAPGKTNWLGFNALTFTVAGAPDGSRLHLRIDDDGVSEEYGDRFNAITTLTLQPNRITIPFSAMSPTPSGRILNFGGVKRLCFFSGDETTSVKPSRIFIDDIRLVNEP